MGFYLEIILYGFYISTWTCFVYLYTLIFSNNFYFYYVTCLFYYNFNLLLYFKYWYFLVINLNIFFFPNIFCFNFSYIPLFVFFFLCYFFITIFSAIFYLWLNFFGIFLLELVFLALLLISSIITLKFIFLYKIFFFFSCNKFFFFNFLSFDFELIVDYISFSFYFLTLIIGVFVYFFTFTYFKNEPCIERLLLLLNLFMVGMMFLVFSNNLIFMFFNWELVGISSFFLINFWSCRINTFKAAFKALIFNKISDFFFFFFVIFVFNLLFSFDITVLITQIQDYLYIQIEYFFFTIYYIDIIFLFFIICAFIKSAQIGLHYWLPDSMEAPVPASALIHSATLVTIGVFILSRMNVLFEISYIGFIVVLFVGSYTAVIGSIVASIQVDIKRILAYSTISHCGCLVVLTSSYRIDFLILYLYFHGLLKAFLFMCTGNIIKTNNNVQHINAMGCYSKFLILELFFCCISLFTLCSLPCSLGFNIKHILFLLFDFSSYITCLVFLNFLFIPIFSFLYFKHFIVYVFFFFKKAKKRVYHIFYKPEINLLNFFYISRFLVNIYFFYLLFLFITIFVLLYITLLSDINIFNKFSLSLLNNKPFLACRYFLHLNYYFLIILVAFLFFCFLFSCKWLLCINYKLYNIYLWFVLFSLY